MAAITRRVAGSGGCGLSVKSRGGQDTIRYKKQSLCNVAGMLPGTYIAEGSSDTHSTSRSQVQARSPSRATPRHTKEHD